MQSEIFIFTGKETLYSYIIDSETFSFTEFLPGLENMKPALVLVENDLLNKDSEEAELFEFLGEKHPKKALTFYLTKWTEKPAVLMGSSFRQSGQLLRSVRTFMENCCESTGRKTYSFLSVPSAFMKQVKPELHFMRTMKVWNAPESKKSLIELMTHVKYDKKASAFKGASAKSELVRRLTAKFATAAKSSVMILGETGTGKAVVARELYRLADMKGQFIVVNCSNIQEELFESEIFGHSRGAFTGASNDKKGLWEMAQDGVLFLDEVGDLSLLNQAKFLTALDRKKIRRVGDDKKEISVNARIVSATNRDLEEMIRRGLFREDLYYRLSTLKIETPPLRERKEDIPDLIKKYWKNKKPLSEPIVEVLCKMDWPGNVRSVKLFLERLNVFFGDQEIKPEHIEALSKY